MASWEGPIELLLAKVKNASGRIGIFVIDVSSAGLLLILIQLKAVGVCFCQFK